MRRAGCSRSRLSRIIGAVDIVSYDLHGVYCAMESDVIDNAALRRFELPIGDHVAVAYYRLNDGKVVLLHTEVPRELSGRGWGSKLAHGVFESIRRSGRRVVAKCPFMASYARRHPQYAALVDE
jgi:predicted GNAT family acetyltransferase